MDWNAGSPEVIDLDVTVDDEMVVRVASESGPLVVTPESLGGILTGLLKCVLAREASGQVIDGEVHLK